MTRPKRTIKRRDARALLSDVLPYELPPTFSNRGLYDFVNRMRLSKSGESYAASQVRPDDDLPLQILLALDAPPVLPSTSAGPARGQIVAKPVRFTIPFQYTVRHKERDYRTLSVPHPAAQIAIAEFYTKYASLILYHTSLSKFSLRHPTKIARYSVVHDRLFNESQSGLDAVEEDGREYEWIRSFFVYERFSNIFKFYDSALYRSCERRFGFLVRADIAKCFDSMYSHSIAWATHGRDVVKANLGGKTLVGTFGDDFDKLMQAMNHNETSGILIGSELSRIFAEIVLQAVDVAVEDELAQFGLVFGRDYEVLRYVDDYFIFLANEAHRELILDAIAKNLRAYKLHLNPAKEEGEHTPWLSPLTIAKQRVRNLTGDAVDLSAIEEGLTSARAGAEHLIVSYKSVLLDTGASHHELANYTLAQIERSMERIISRVQQVLREDVGILPNDRIGLLEGATSCLLGLLDFAFFAYSGSPRMSPTVKLARITSSLVRFGRSEGVPVYDRERIVRSVYVELAAQLRRGSLRSRPDAVTATLLDCLSDLGEEYRLSQSELADVAGFVRSGSDVFVPPRYMNVLLLVSLLFHSADDPGHDTLRVAYEEWILSTQERSERDAERALVALNVLSCPFVSRKTRKAVAASWGSTLGASRWSGQGAFRWNVDWEGFDLYAALQRKRLYEVY